MTSHSVFESCKLKERIVFTACNFPKTNSKLKATGFQELKTVFLASPPPKNQVQFRTCKATFFLSFYSTFCEATTYIVVCVETSPTTSGLDQIADGRWA